MNNPIYVTMQFVIITSRLDAFHSGPDPDCFVGDLAGKERQDFFATLLLDSKPGSLTSKVNVIFNCLDLEET